MTIRRRQFLATSVAICFGSVVARAGRAGTMDDYPNRPVKIVVPYPAGGGTDFTARQLADALSNALGQPFIVENRPGANGSIGAQHVAAAVPDGYTLMLGFISELALNPVVMAKPPYNPVKDFAPIAGLRTPPLVLVVNAETPFQSAGDLIARARETPDALSYASWGQGSLNHLATAMFLKMIGAKMVHVPYKGSAPAVTDVVAGHVPVMFAATITVEKHIKSKKLRALFVASAKRLPILQDVPAAIEVGLPEMLIRGWLGFVAPAGTPRPIIGRLNAEFNKAVRSPALASVFEREGIEPMTGSPEQFGAFMRSEIAHWREVVKESGFTPES